jgi:Sec-independent protein translocase protein TatA
MKTTKNILAATLLATTLFGSQTAFAAGAGRIIDNIGRVAILVDAASRTTEAVREYAEARREAADRAAMERAERETRDRAAAVARERAERTERERASREGGGRTMNEGERALTP